jgi:hypothetical protein
VQRQCAWFGCSSVATATYTFDSNAQTVWLDEPLEGGARAGELCHRHARSLTPPRGWSLEDRRRVAAAEAETPRMDDVAAETADRDRYESAAEYRTLLDAHSPLLARAFRSSGTV